MSGKVIRWLLSSTGYLLYTLVVLVCLLWLLFPADAVQDWLEQQLDKQYSQFSWKIGSLSLALPDGLVMTNVRIASASVSNKKSLLTLDRFAIAPEVTHLFRKNKAMKYSLHMLEGVVRGQVLLTAGSKQFTCQGILDGLHLEQLGILEQRLQRTFDGTVAGKYSSQGAWDALRQAQLQGNLTITDGTLQFRKPVLGLGELPYTKIETGFSLDNGQWMFEQGTLQSTMMRGTFSGMVQAGETLADSQLQFKGGLTPRSEMFAGFTNQQMVQVVRAHLKDGGLPFTVNGTAGEPGILFGDELSSALKSLQGSTR